MWANAGKWDLPDKRWGRPGKRWQDEVGLIADEQAGEIPTGLADEFDLSYDSLGIQHDTIADDTDHVRAEHA